MKILPIIIALLMLTAPSWAEFDTGVRMGGPEKCFKGCLDPTEECMRKCAVSQAIWKLIHKAQPLEFKLLVTNMNLDQASEAMADLVAELAGVSVKQQQKVCEACKKAGVYLPVCVRP